MSSAILRFTCRRLIFTCNIAVPFSSASFNELREELRREGATIRQREVVAVFDDPVEALAIAQRHDGTPVACIASPAALELLREPSELATSTWRWLCLQLELDPTTAFRDGLVYLNELVREAWNLDEERLPAGLVLWIAGSLVGFEARTSFGRAELGAARASYRIVDHAMARRHFVIEPSGDRWVIEDLGSAGGTYLDRQRVGQPTELVPGMVINAGTSTFAVVATG